MNQRFSTMVSRGPTTLDTYSICVDTFCHSYGTELQFFSMQTPPNCLRRAYSMNIFCHRKWVDELRGIMYDSACDSSCRRDY